MSAAIHLHGNAARFGLATVEAHHGLVVVSIADESTRFGLRLEVNPTTAQALAQALLAAAGAGAAVQGGAA